MTVSKRGAEITVTDVDASSDPGWDRLVGDLETDVFHSPEWSRCLRDGFGFDVRARLVHHDGAPVAGIAYVDVDDPRGRRIISLPFSDFCDPLVDASFPYSLVDLLAVDGAPVTVRTLRTRPDDDDDRWSETGSFAWHRIDVARDLDQAWEDLHPSARRAVRKAQSSGVEVVPAASLDDVRSFHDMHLRIRKYKYGLLAQPFSFFEAIWDNFLSHGRGRLLLAKHEDEVVGGVLYLEWKSTLYYKFNASDSTRLQIRPNDLLVWEGIRHAHHRGLRWLDFGVSDWDQEGLLRYKRKYATEEGVVRRLTAGGPPRDRLSAYLGSITDLFVDPSVPDEVTRRAGDLLYPLFSS